MHLNLSQSIDELNDRHYELEGNVTGDIKELQDFVEKLGMLRHLLIVLFSL